MKLRQLTIEKKRRREAYYFILPAFFLHVISIGLSVDIQCGIKF